jgi:hypothetical protein
VTPVFIIARDRLTYLRRTVASLSHVRDTQLYIVDHGTTDPEAIDWMRYDCPFSVFWRGDQRVHDFWSWGGLVNLGWDRPYAVTDPDIDFTDVPEDLIATCHLALTAFPHIVKAGPALRLDDVPDTDLGKRVKNWEVQFWDREIAPRVYEAPIDTTFAVYRPVREQREFLLGPGARIAGVYQVRHMPWYETGPASDELRHYREHAREGSSHWPPEG